MPYPRFNGTQTNNKQKRYINPGPNGIHVWIPVKPEFVAPNVITDSVSAEPHTPIIIQHQKSNILVDIILKGSSKTRFTFIRSCWLMWMWPRCGDPAVPPASLSCACAWFLANLSRPGRCGVYVCDDGKLYWWSILWNCLCGTLWSDRIGYIHSNLTHADGDVGPTERPECGGYHFSVDATTRYFVLFAELSYNLSLRVADKESGSPRLCKRPSI